MVFPLSINTSVIGTTIGPLSEHSLKHSLTRRNESRSDFWTAILVVQRDLRQRNPQRSRTAQQTCPKMSYLFNELYKSTEQDLGWLQLLLVRRLQSGKAVGTALNNKCQGGRFHACMPACGAVLFDEMTIIVGGFIAGDRSQGPHWTVVQSSNVLQEPSVESIQSQYVLIPLLAQVELQRMLTCYEDL